MLAKGETRIEVMLKMIKCGKHHLTHKGVPAEKDADEFWLEFWAHVKLLSMRGQQAYIDEMDDLVCFVQQLAGGIDNPVNLLYLRDFIRTLKVEREVDGEVFGALAKVKIGYLNAAPKFRIACLMACSSASAKYVRNDTQTLLTPQDISTLAGKNKTFALQAEEMLEIAHGMVDMEDSRQRATLYILEVRLVHHVFRKVDESRGKFATQADIGHQFTMELQAVMGKKVKMHWSPSRPADTSS